MGKVFFGVWKMGGGRGRDIIRKYTFESGARPAAGTASIFNKPLASKTWDQFRKEVATSQKPILQSRYQIAKKLALL